MRSTFEALIKSGGKPRYTMDSNPRSLTKIIDKFMERIEEEDLRKAVSALPYNVRAQGYKQLSKEVRAETQGGKATRKAANEALEEGSKSSGTSDEDKEGSLSSQYSLLLAVGRSRKKSQVNDEEDEGEGQSGPPPAPTRRKRSD